jgi:hypothetical protein
MLTCEEMNKTNGKRRMTMRFKENERHMQAKSAANLLATSGWSRDGKPQMILDISASILRFGFERTHKLQDNFLGWFSQHVGENVESTPASSVKGFKHLQPKSSKCSRNRSCRDKNSNSSTGTAISGAKVTTTTTASVTPTQSWQQHAPMCHAHDDIGCALVDQRVNHRLHTGNQSLATLQSEPLGRGEFSCQERLKPLADRNYRQSDAEGNWHDGNST